MRRMCLATLHLALVLAACDSGSTRAPRLPMHFGLDATAAVEEDGLAVDCRIGFVVEVSGVVSQTDSVVEYIATMGGDAERTLLRPDGSGVSFWAHAHYPRLQVLHILPDRVQLVSLDFPPDGPPTGSRFWDELRFFEGFLQRDGTIEGDWTCAPLDTEQNGVMDDAVFAAGNWSTRTITP